MPSASKKNTELCLIPLPLAVDVRPGDSLAEILLSSLPPRKLAAGDILVIKHKIVSKAEGQVVELNRVSPSASTRAWARRNQLDARVTEVALAQSRRIVRRKRNVLITETRHGFICANSGVDVSNVNGGSQALLLPEDPDQSALRLHRELKKRLQLSIPVIISDSFGRPWREGLTDVAIGLSGLRPLRDYRGHRDPHGYPLHSTVEAVADELACAAGLVCGKLERTPVCIIRGFAYRSGPGSAQQLIRPAKYDLFR